MAKNGSRWWSASICAIIFSCSIFLCLAASNEDVAGTTFGEAAQLIDLHEDNWQLMLQGEWMVEFFAPWCPACKNLAPTWEHFASVAGDYHVNVAKIDVTTSPSLSGRFFVTALPTIFHVKEGEFRHYRGSRDGDALVLFLKQKQWQKIEPISSWKKPDTIHMSILSYFFKLSHTLKDFNIRLQEDYGLPTWGSYGLFAVGTIFVGATLGLLLVCIVDFLYPPKKSQRQSFNETKENYIDDIAIDEIEDDGDLDAPNTDDEKKEIDEDEEEDDDDEKKLNDDDEDGDTSDGEKNSHSEEEDEKKVAEAKEKKNIDESQKNATFVSEKTNDAADEITAATTAAATTAAATTTTKSNTSNDVRKRKPRKAD